MKKTDQVLAAYRSGDMKTALRIAKGFNIGITREDSHDMSMAYECMVHPEFYRSLGRDVDGTIAKGVEVLECTVCAGCNVSP